MAPLVIKCAHEAHARSAQLPCSLIQDCASFLPTPRAELCGAPPLLLVPPPKSPLLRAGFMGDMTSAARRLVDPPLEDRGVLSTNLGPNRLGASRPEYAFRSTAPCSFLAGLLFTILSLRLIARLSASPAARNGISGGRSGDPRRTGPFPGATPDAHCSPLRLLSCGCPNR
jgi:hypothetical protein